MDTVDTHEGTSSIATRAFAAPQGRKGYFRQLQTISINAYWLNR